MFSSAPLLLVIDCQVGFVTADAVPIIPTVASIVEAWKDADLPVIATRFVNPPQSPYRRILGWHQCDGPPETNIVDELAPLLDGYATITDKPVYTFFTPAWVDQLRADGRGDVVMVGLDTDACVLKCALDAFEADFTPWIVTDATASHSGQRAHDAALYIAGRTVGKGQLVSVAETLAELDVSPWRESAQGN